MKPISPVVPEYVNQEVVYAKDQPEYLSLPALPVDNGERIITRWRMSWRERISVLFSGDVYLWVMPCRRPLQPVLLQAHKPEITASETA